MTHYDSLLLLIGLKKYMELRTVDNILQDRVIRWFDYLWGAKKELIHYDSLNMSHRI